MKETHQETREVEVVRCDVCGKPANHGPVCIICGCDLCRDCGRPDFDDLGTWLRFFCQSCWDAGEAYRAKRQELFQQWCNAALAKKAKKR